MKRKNTWLLDSKILHFELDKSEGTEKNENGKYKK